MQGSSYRSGNEHPKNDIDQPLGLGGTAPDREWM
jgi:hypothetical protein